MLLSEKQRLTIHYIEVDPDKTEILYGGGAGCFSGDTVVKTDKGVKPISQIKKGETVLSFNTAKNIPEYKIVLDKYIYGGAENRHKMIIFTFDNNQQIKCTYEHKFYIEGDWQPAYRIAERAMDVGEWDKQSVCNKQYGQANDNWLQRFKESFNNEPRKGCEWLFEDNVSISRQKQNGKNSQVSCSGMDKQSISQTMCEPCKRQKRRQSCSKSGMEHGSGERKTRIRKWLDKETYLHKLCQRLKNWYFKTKRGTSKGNKDEIQAEDLHSRNAGKGVQCFTSYDKGCDFKAMEARCIDLSKIKNISFQYSEENVYDLKVETNHNYVLCVGDTIVHNSGKSFLGCFWQISRRLSYPGTRGLIGRSKLGALKKTTLRTFRDVWQAYFENNHYGITYKENNQDNIIYFSNGSEIILKDLFQYPSDMDFVSLGSLEITDAFIDEATEIKRKARDIIQSRIRYRLINNKPVLLMSCNPGPGFVKDEFVSDSNNVPVDPKPYQVFIKALLDDNIDKDFVERYKKQLEKMPLYDRLRLLNGDWSVSENDAPFFHSFNSDLHIGKTEIVNHEPLYLSFDFNIDPTTVVIGQKIHGQPLMIHQVIQVKGGTEKLCNEIEHLRNHPAGLIVTGDFSGNTGSTAAGMLEGGIYNTDFNIIKNKLYLSDYDFVSTKAANPRHDYSRRVCNYIFERSKIHIHPDCKVLITDIQVAQVTDKGKLRKDRDTFKMDACDAFRYMINAWFPNGFADIQTFNDLLL